MDDEIKYKRIKRRLAAMYAICMSVAVINSVWAFLVHNLWVFAGFSCFGGAIEALRQTIKIMEGKSE